MAVLEETIDIAVIGAGHAGCEAALAAARMGLETVVFTVSVDSIAMMPCNPNIGGTSKGHLVKEIDALGGEMGKNIDKTFIQSKMLNQSKGPAVHSLRAQADKRAYSQSMREVLENTDHLTIRQMEIAELIVEDGVLTGVKAVSGAVYHCKAAVLCTGVYLNARCIYGDVSTYTGPNGLAGGDASDGFPESERRRRWCVLKQEHRRVLTSGALTFRKWKSSLAMSALCRSHSRPIRRAYRSIRNPAG